MRRCVLKARYVFPVSGPPVADGAVVVDGGRIVSVGKDFSGDEARDLGNAAILPGLVNAHAHLEFSDLSAPLGEPGIGFADWIRLVGQYRRLLGDASRAIAKGLHESLRRGAAAIGEIAQADWPTDVESPLCLTLFRELIAPTAQRAVETLKLANFPSTSDASRQWGLGPHAPYSVHPELLEAVAVRSAAERFPLAMHLAESQEEMQLLQSGEGPLGEFLREIGAWDSITHRPGRRPMDFLRVLSKAHRALVVHGGYLDDEEIAFLGAHADRMTVVYCPRTHAWFGRRAYPLEQMLASGVGVALGTDGRGSSPDLSVFGEMRAAAEAHPKAGLDQILRMGTLLGAKALGWENQLGSLAPGKRAWLAVVPLPHRDAADPHRLLFDADGDASYSIAST